MFNIQHWTSRCVRFFTIFAHFVIYVYVTHHTIIKMLLYSFVYNTRRIKNGFNSIGNETSLPGDNFNKRK